MLGRCRDGAGPAGAGLSGSGSDEEVEDAPALHPGNASDASGEDEDESGEDEDEDESGSEDPEQHSGSDGSQEGSESDEEAAAEAEPW
jgi:hypothetical protein